MADTTIGGLSEEMTAGEIATDEVYLEAENVTAGRTKKVKPDTLAAGIAPTFQRVYDAGAAPALTTDTTRGAVTITTSGLGPALALRADLGSVVDGLWLHAGGLSSTEAIEIGPEPPASGDGKNLRLWGGTAAPDGLQGGNVSISAGDGPTPGDVRIGTESCRWIYSGNGSAVWEHNGDLNVLGDLTVDGEIHAPPKAPVVESSTGLVIATAPHHERSILCTNASGCAVTVPDTLEPGTTVELVQGAGAGQVEVVAGLGVTLLHSGAFLPKTAGAGSSLVVTMLDGLTALVRGDLEAAA